MSLNKVMLIGNVGRDPEIRHLADDSMVARFSLATSERYKLKSGEVEEQVEWHQIVAWHHLAKLAEDYIKRGSKLYIEGKIRSNSWIEKGSGERRESIDIVANKILLLERREEQSSQKSPSQQLDELINSSN